ncbi:MAG: hypothetical protein H6741_24030 [Alphaproteobacteria bacterium]|nr:hypothetical protein [Alphaproteobacteria bacterium]
MSPEDQASQLARWLAERPGAEPPDGLDPEVIEAVYALRPDLAPAPRVTVDDILAGVGVGPFAHLDAAPEGAAQGAPPLPEQVPGVDAEVVPFSVVAARRRRLWGGLGALAAAALVLIVALPALDEAPGPGSDPLKQTERMLMDAPAQEAEPVASGDLQQPMAEGAEGPADLPKPAAAPPPPRAPAKASPPSARTPQGNVASSGGGSAGPGTYDQLELGRSASGEAWTPEEAQAASAPSPLEPVSAVAQTEAAFEDGLASPSQSGASALDDIEEANARPARREREGLFDRRDASNTVSPEPVADAGSYDWGADEAVADNDRYSAEEEELVEEEPIPTDVAGLRGLAWPGDYSDGWWRGTSAEPRMAPVLSEASAAAGRGDPSAAARACAALIADPSAPVGQDMAWRAASYALQAGDSASASRWIAQGKQRSSANTAFLARLWALEGQVLEARGDTEGARQAYRTAAVLNQAR